MHLPRRQCRLLWIYVFTQKKSALFSHSVFCSLLPAPYTQFNTPKSMARMNTAHDSFGASAAINKFPEVIFLFLFFLSLFLYQLTSMPLYWLRSVWLLFAVELLPVWSLLKMAWLIVWFELLWNEESLVARTMLMTIVLNYFLKTANGSRKHAGSHAAASMQI